MEQNSEVQQQHPPPEVTAQPMQKDTRTKRILIIMVVVTILSLSFSGFLYNQNVQLKKGPETDLDSGQTSNNKLIELENELKSCLSDEASMTAPIDDGEYQFSTFKVYSPLLLNKSVSRVEFEYKQALIVSKTIELNENLSISVWLLEKSSKYIPTLPERLSKKTDPLDLTYPLYDFPIFDGYEWINAVDESKYISARITESHDSNRIYKAKNGITMYRISNPCPKFICSTELYFYSTTDQGKTQVFGQIIATVKEWGDEQSINSAFDTAEIFADTLSFEEY